VVAYCIKKYWSWRSNKV